MNYYTLVLISSAIGLLTCSSSCSSRKTVFSTAETDEKVVLLEDDNPVLVYQKQPKSLTGQYVCNNYLHPLFDLNGNILTEEFPADHPYHRGVFWAWHQLYADGKRLGDGWTNDSISQKVTSVNIEKNKHFARLKNVVQWYSSVAGDGKPFMEEKNTITVHKLRDSLRIIDFEIGLNALVPDLQIGGSPDEKGYGGFCVRLRLSDSLEFTSDKGQVTPRELQVKAGPWMDFSGRFGRGEEISGLTILCHPSLPDYPEPWILRQKGSMQNAVFPGRERIDFPSEKPFILRYRIIIHNRGPKSLDMIRLSDEYSKTRSN